MVKGASQEGASSEGNVNRGSGRGQDCLKAQEREVQGLQGPQELQEAVETDIPHGLQKLGETAVIAARCPQRPPELPVLHPATPPIGHGLLDKIMERVSSQAQEPEQLPSVKSEWGKAPGPTGQTLEQHSGRGQQQASCVRLSATSGSQNSYPLLVYQNPSPLRIPSRQQIVKFGPLAVVPGQDQSLESQTIAAQVSPGASAPLPLSSSAVEFLPIVEAKVRRKGDFNEETESLEGGRMPKVRGGELIVPDQSTMSLGTDRRPQVLKRNLALKLRGGSGSLSSKRMRDGTVQGDYSVPRPSNVAPPNACSLSGPSRQHSGGISHGITRTETETPPGGLNPNPGQQESSLPRIPPHPQPPCLHPGIGPMISGPANLLPAPATAPASAGGTAGQLLVWRDGRWVNGTTGISALSAVQLGTWQATSRLEIVVAEQINQIRRLPPVIVRRNVWDQDKMLVQHQGAQGHGQGQRQAGPTFGVATPGQHQHEQQSNSQQAPAPARLQVQRLPDLPEVRWFTHHIFPGNEVAERAADVAAADVAAVDVAAPDEAAADGAATGQQAPWAQQAQQVQQVQQVQEAQQQLRAQQGQQVQQPQQAQQAQEVSQAQLGQAQWLEQLQAQQLLPGQQEIMTQQVQYQQLHLQQEQGQHLGQRQIGMGLSGVGDGQYLQHVVVGQQLAPGVNIWAPGLQVPRALGVVSGEVPVGGQPGLSWDDWDRRVSEWVEEVGGWREVEELARIVRLQEEEEGRQEWEERQRKWMKYEEEK
ncbi:hypothetical protein BDZ91DRAFT_796259 [Kalaharituber pfeilii]|nr:hypothetical protein BDZ91DRAFT_796259 [Kalaharituber pfeilii]